MKSIIIAFSMYSKVPMPQVEWDKRSLSWALVAFPLVGAVIGGVLVLWLWAAEQLGWKALEAAGALLLPIVLSGGIHLDGFCDTCDALSSHQSRERKLEILKDSHTGAFAVICCGLYLLVFYSAWWEVELGLGEYVALGLLPVLSRCLSAYSAITSQNARGSGLLATFTAPMDGKRAKGVVLALMALVLIGMAYIPVTQGRWDLLAVPVGAMLSLVYYRNMTKKKFGGVTGDTAGYFLQVTECAALLLLVLAQKGWEML